MIEIFSMFHSFFFAPSSFSSLEAFRFFFGLTIVLDSFVLGSHAEAAFGQLGYLPSGVVHGAKRFELLSYISGSPTLLKLFFFSMGVAGFGLAFGLRPDVMQLIIFLSLISALGRNPYSHHSGRKLALIWSFLLLFSVHPWAVQLMKIQLMIVYFFTVLHKSQHKNWFDGSMVYKVLAGSSCRRPDVAMPSFITYRWISSLLTWSTMAIQLIAPVLLWDERTFWIGAVALWSMHLGIETFFRMPTFQVYMICGPLLFLPANATEWLHSAISIS